MRRLVDNAFRLLTDPSRCRNAKHSAVNVRVRNTHHWNACIPETFGVFNIASHAPVMNKERRGPHIGALRHAEPEKRKDSSNIDGLL